jgi:hypothetical protein
MNTNKLVKQSLMESSLHKTRNLFMEQTTRSISIRKLLARAGETAGLLAVLILLRPNLLWGAPIPVRFVEGSLHAFLALRTLDGTLIASGDLVQISRGEIVESRMTFHFGDGSMFDEKVVFSQQRFFKLENYHLMYSGPSFTSDTDIALERTSGKYRVKTKRHEDGKEEVLTGSLELPLDAYNGGMVLTVAKNLSSDAGETVHTVAFTPKPRLVQLALMPAGEEKTLVGQLTKSTTHFVLKPQLGMWLRLITTLVGRVPPDNHTWIAFDRVPAFLRFEGPLYVAGPVWRIEPMGPRWRD